MIRPEHRPRDVITVGVGQRRTGGARGCELDAAHLAMETPGPGCRAWTAFSIR